MHTREGGYIGGDLSYQERYERYIKPILSELPRTDSYNPADQCRCGTTARVRYRGRWYCPRCGRRSTPKAVPGGKERDIPRDRVSEARTQAGER